MKLNESREPYKAFEGNMPEQMQALIADGRIPMNFAHLAQRQLDTRNGSEDVKRSWLDNYFDLGDTIFYHPDGKGSWDKFKIVLDSKDLRNLSPEVLQDGRLVFSEDYYKQLDAQEFKKSEIMPYLNHGQSRKEADNNPVLVALARNKSLLKDSNAYLFSEGNFDKGRGIYVLNSVEKPEMRAWYAIFTNDAKANGNDLIDINGRFVGLAPEALSGNGKGLKGQIKTYTMADLQKFENLIDGLEGTLHDSKISELRKIKSKM